MRLIMVVVQMHFDFELSEFMDCGSMLKMRNNNWLGTTESDALILQLLEPHGLHLFPKNISWRYFQLLGFPSTTVSSFHLSLTSSLSIMHPPPSFAITQEGAERYEGRRVLLLLPVRRRCSFTVDL